MKKQILLFTITFLAFVICSPHLDLQKNKFRGMNVCIPLSFYGANSVPLMKIEIESNRFLVMIDTGMTGLLTLDGSLLDGIKNKKAADRRDFLDLKGKGYSSPLFSVPLIEILGEEGLSLTIKDGMVALEEPSFLNEGSRFGAKTKEEQREQGRIGLPFFSTVNCLFDFPHRSLFLVKKGKSFLDKSYQKSFVEVPFQLEKNKLFLMVETEFGPKRVFLDTGSTHSMLRGGENFSAIQSNCLVIGGQNYGSWWFGQFPFNADSLEFDGILGVDFMRMYAIGLDFENQKAYIQKPRSRIGFLLLEAYWYLSSYLFNGAIFPRSSSEK